MLKALLMVFSCCCLYVQAQTLAPIRVVTEYSPPHQTLVQGEVSGLSTELVLAILAEAGVSATIEMFPWARAFNIARSQPNVLIYNMARTPEREEQFHWLGTVAAYQLGFVGLSHRQDITITSLDEALAFTIAVQRDDLSANFLLQQGFELGVQLVLVADISESWQLLRNGKVDLIIDDAVALNDMVAKLDLPQSSVRFVYAIPQLKQQTWLAASLATSPELINAIKFAHKKIALSPRYHQIMSSSYRE